MRWQKSKTMENTNIANYVNIFACVRFKIAHYSNARSLWKGVPALRCHVQNISNASELRQAVIEWYFRNSSWLWNYCTIKRRVILSNVKQKCGPLPTGCEVNLNRLNFIEIELFIKMFYGVWSSLQPDHETNKSPRRMQISPPARNDDRSPIWKQKHLKTSDIFSLPRISTKDFPYIKVKIDRSIGINYSSVNFKWTQVFLCCQSFDRRGQWIF